MEEEIEEVISNLEDDDIKRRNLSDLKKIRYKLKKIPENLTVKKEV